MQSSTVRFVLALTTLLLLLVIATRMANGGSPLADAIEIERIRQHLERVELELATADVDHLTPQQREARAQHLRVLREYRERGRFPHNHVVPDRAVPVFVDERGTHCAVGYLIARSGRHDLVERIAASRNLATVHQLADDAELARWLDQAGLSVDEAARIQPMYNWQPPPEPGSRAYETATIVATGLGGGMIAWNLVGGDEHRSLKGMLGLGIGIGQIVLGSAGPAIEREHNRDIDGTHIAINLGVGIVSSLLGIRTLTRPAPTGPAAARTSEQAARAVDDGPRWSLAPWAAAGGAGARLRITF